tara:strand:- start:301 stop:561 length:261 start_codon:yes stop_codon:yes gene_type:complete
MKIAGVGVNIKSLPSKERLIEQALKGIRFYQMPVKKALILINLEIKESGLFKADTKRVKKTNSKRSEDSSGSDYNKQPEHNKTSKE